MATNKKIYLQLISTQGAEYADLLLSISIYIIHAINKWCAKMQRYIRAKFFIYSLKDKKKREVSKSFWTFKIRALQSFPKCYSDDT